VPAERSAKSDFVGPAGSARLRGRPFAEVPAEAEATGLKAQTDFAGRAGLHFLPMALVRLWSL